MATPHINPEEQLLWPLGDNKTETRSYREIIMEIIKASITHSDNVGRPLYMEATTGDSEEIAELIGAIADDFINNINSRADIIPWTSDKNLGTYSGLVKRGTVNAMNPNVFYLLNSSFPVGSTSVNNNDFQSTVSEYKPDDYTSLPPMSGENYGTSGRYDLGEVVTGPAQIWNKWANDTAIMKDLSEGATSKLGRTNLNNVLDAFEDYAANVRDIGFKDFLDLVVLPTVDASGAVGLLAGNKAVDMLQNEFEAQGRLSFDDITPNYLQEWNKTSAIVDQAYSQHLAKLRALNKRLADAGDDKAMNAKLTAEYDKLLEEWDSWLSDIVSDFPSEEDMVKNEQVLTEQGRQQIMLKKARETGIMQSGTLEDTSTALARAFEEIEKRYMEVGPDADYDQIVEDYLGANGEKFQSRFGAAPPAMPGLPDAKEAQKRYQEVVASGGGAKEIMDALYGITPYESTPEEQNQAKMLQESGIATDIDVAQAMASGDPEALKQVLIDKGLYYAIDEEEVIETGVEPLSELASTLLDQQGKLGSAAMGQGAYVQEPYIPPEEIDSRLYAPAAPNIGFELPPPVPMPAVPGGTLPPVPMPAVPGGTLPPVPMPAVPGGTPRTVRYDAEGRQLGPLYSDVMADAQATIDARSAEMGINPDEYTTGSDPTLDAAYKSLDDAYVARSAAEESIAMDESGAKAPHEVDDVLPPPTLDAPQFTTRTRGGRRGY